MGQRYKYNLGVNLNSGTSGGNTLRLEGFGDDRHELLRNCFVYVLDADGSEVDVVHMNDTSDFIFGQCINKVRGILSFEELEVLGE